MENYTTMKGTLDVDFNQEQVNVPKEYIKNWKQLKVYIKI